MDEKPQAQVIGENGNVFNILAICSRALKRAGKRKEAYAMQNRVMNFAEDYDKALQIMMEYVEFV
jgi:hypothetical protein